MTLKNLEYVDLISLESAKLSELGLTELNTPIAHLKNWSIKTVVGHLGWAMRYAALTITAKIGESPSRSSVSDPPPTEELIDWLKQSTETLLTSVESANLDMPVETIAGPKPASWWLRRIALELAIHRCDVHIALNKPIGASDSIDASLAAEGIDEVLGVFAQQRLDFVKLDSAGLSLHLHATDSPPKLEAVADEWLIEFGSPDPNHDPTTTNKLEQSNELRWNHTHKKATCAVKDTRSNMLLLLWGRLDPTQTTTFGDATILERWQQAATF